MYNDDASDHHDLGAVFLADFQVALLWASIGAACLLALLVGPEVPSPILLGNLGLAIFASGVLAGARAAFIAWRRVGPIMAIVLRLPCFLPFIVPAVMTGVEGAATIVGTAALVFAPASQRDVLRRLWH